MQSDVKVDAEFGDVEVVLRTDGGGHDIDPVWRLRLAALMLGEHGWRGLEMHRHIPEYNFDRCRRCSVVAESNVSEQRACAEGVAPHPVCYLIVCGRWHRRQRGEEQQKSVSNVNDGGGRES